MSIVVTKHNFDKLLPHILEDVSRSSFVAMDTEFTGLRTAPEFATLPVDSHDVRYSRMRKSVSQTGLLQIGIVPFIYDSENDKFVHRSYSFYLTELQKFAVMDPGNSGKVIERLHSASSCHFLRDNKFDFNDYYDEAISYMSRRSEEALRMNLLQESFDNVAVFSGKSEYVPKSENPAIFLDNEPVELFPLCGALTQSSSKDESNIIYVRSPKDTEWFQYMRQSVNSWIGLTKKWIKDPNSVKVNIVPISAMTSSNSITHYTESDSELILVDFQDKDSGQSVLVPHFRMPHLSRWRRKVTITLLEQSLEGSELKGDIHFMSQADAIHSTSDSTLKSIHVFWLHNLSGGREYLNNLYFKSEMERVSKTIDNAVGFRKVIDSITENSVPLIGHHCLYDLLHIVDKFVGELPEDVSDFSRLVSELFPGGFYDTKYLSSFGAVAGAPDALMDSAFSRFVSLEDLYNITKGSSEVKYRVPPCLAAVKDAELLLESKPEEKPIGVNGPTGNNVDEVNTNVRSRRNKKSGIQRKIIEVSVDWRNYLDSEPLPPPKLQLNEDPIETDSLEVNKSAIDGVVTNDTQGDVIVNSGASHDAGYDATMTGIVFLKLLSRLVSVANSFSPNKVSIIPDDIRRLPYEMANAVLNGDTHSPGPMNVPSWFIWEPIPPQLLSASVMMNGNNSNSGNSNDCESNEEKELSYNSSFPVLSAKDSKNALDVAKAFFRDHSDSVNRYDIPISDIDKYGSALPLIQVMNRVAVSPFTDFIGPTFLLGSLDVQGAASISNSKRGKNAVIRKEHLASDILNPLLFSRSIQNRRSWVHISNIYPSLSNQDVLKIVGDTLDIRLTNSSLIYRQMQTSAFVILPSEHHVHLLVSEWMYSRFGQSLDEKYENECDDLLPADEKPSFISRNVPESTGLLSKWAKAIDSTLSSISFFLTGRDNGDNMLGLSGWRKRPSSESFDTKGDFKRRVDQNTNLVVYPSGRKVYIPPGLPQSLFEVEVLRAQTGFMDPLTVSYDDAILLSSNKQNLGSFTVMPYKHWLHTNKDVYNGTCDHEC